MQLCKRLFSMGYCLMAHIFAATPLSMSVDLSECVCVYVSLSAPPVLLLCGDAYAYVTGIK